MKKALILFAVVAALVIASAYNVRISVTPNAAHADCSTSNC